MTSLESVYQVGDWYRVLCHLQELENSTFDVKSSSFLFATVLCAPNMVSLWLASVSNLRILHNAISTWRSHTSKSEFRLSDTDIAYANLPMSNGCVHIMYPISPWSIGDCEPNRWSRFYHGANVSKMGVHAFKCAKYTNLRMWANEGYTWQRQFVLIILIWRHLHAFSSTASYCLGAAAMTFVPWREIFVRLQPCIYYQGWLWLHSWDTAHIFKIAIMVSWWVPSFRFF